MSTRASRIKSAAALGLDRRRIEAMAALCHPDRHGRSVLAASAHQYWRALLDDLDTAARLAERKARPVRLTPKRPADQRLGDLAGG